MAGVYDGAVQALIDELGRLPGIGPKGAQRIAFYLLEADDSEVDALVGALESVKSKVRFCEICGNVTEDKLCRICADLRRLDSVICVVEEAKDIVAIERSREYRGRYHVLGGAIDPIGGIGPEDLRIRELYARLGSGVVQEVILAMDPNVEGEATATYLSLNLSHMNVIVSRLASGLPVGGDLEYADEVTISRAMEGRQRIHTPST
ncbi:recombination mediator RecR [Trueperella bernardiae]|uniref:recombination mediator RecR n=1 Tax=Trueperella bernardiae TaxID=59561 RepID=UPI0035CF8907